jgi:hypothetical protein
MSKIRILRLLTSEEVLAEVIEETPDSYTVKNPCLIGLTMNPGGTPGLNIQRMLMFSEQTVVSLSKAHILFEVTVDMKIQTRYNEIFGNIIVPEQQKIILA